MALLKEKLKLNNFNLKSLFKKEKRNEIAVINSDSKNEDIFKDKSIAEVLHEKFLSKRLKFFKKKIFKNFYYSNLENFKVLLGAVAFTMGALFFIIFLLIEGEISYFQILNSFSPLGLLGLMIILLSILLALIAHVFCKETEFEFKEIMRENKIKTKSFIKKCLTKEEAKALKDKINHILENVSPIARQNFENSKGYLFSYIELEKAYKENQLLNRLKENLEEKAIIAKRQELKDMEEQEKNRLIAVKNEIEKMDLRA